MNVTVIIPTWNRADTIQAAVKSALRQTYPVHEVLVCDDGSSDNTEEAVRSINDQRVEWLPGLRGGRPAIPRNRGIRQSRGEWLAFLDSDDEWRSDKLERQLTVAKELNCRAICSNALRYIPGRGNAGNVLDWNEPKTTLRHLLAVNLVICSSVLIHRSLVVAIEGFPEDVKLKALEDYALWLRVATLTDFAYVNEPLVLYRDDPANSVRVQGVTEWIQKRCVLSDYLGWVSRHRLGMLPQSLITAISTMAGLGLRSGWQSLLSFGSRLKRTLRKT